jgi:YfiH family protein
MPFLQNDLIKYYTFASLAEHPVKQAIFTRHGGVSPQPWASLNLGSTVGDDPKRVVENRRRAFNALGVELSSLYDVWQVHSTDVVYTDCPRPLYIPHLKADAILTDRPGVNLFMRFADCVPILLYDPMRPAVGLVHAGWKGTVTRVAAVAVGAMQAKLGSQPADLVAAIGPSIGPHHYEIGPEVISQVKQAFGQDAIQLLQKTNRGAAGSLQFDLWNANRLVLEGAGVRQIEIAEICTACHLEDWYSHRGEHGSTGRFGVLLGIETQ